MTNLERWTLLAKDVMDKLALSDDPQRLVVIATALAGAAQAVREEPRKLVAKWRKDSGEFTDVDLADATVWACAAELETALSDDGARAGKQ